MRLNTRDFHLTLPLCYTAGNLQGIYEWMSLKDKLTITSQSLRPESRLALFRRAPGKNDPSDPGDRALPARRLIWTLRVALESHRGNSHLRVRLLFPYLAIDEVEDIVHHILLRHGTHCCCDQQRVQNQADGPNCYLIHPVLRAHSGERSTTDLLQGDTKCLVKTRDGPQGALLL